ncbi:hypothetical protein [Gryllotalpicola koreensis]
MHHIGIGRAHAGRRAIALADEHEITVIDLPTGEVLSTHPIQPNKSYWPRQSKEPGQRPGSSKK